MNQRGELFKQITTQMSEVYTAKNHDYGGSFTKSMDEFGLMSPVIRLSDKLERLKSLQRWEPMVADEKIEDTLLDLANYAVMTLVELQMKRGEQGCQEVVE